MDEVKSPIWKEKYHGRKSKKDEIMVNESLILKINQLRARGATYDEIASELKVGFSTISEALKKVNSSSPRSSSDLEASFSHDKDFIYDENPTLPFDSSFTEESREDINSDAFINKEATRLVGGSGGLYRVPVDNPGRFLNSQLIDAPLPSWFWKLFFVFIGIVIFIRILKRMRENSFEND
jgi:hypothetical protein